MSSITQTAGTGSDDGFIGTYGISIAVIFVALVVFHLPIIGLINLLPVFKEVLLGAAVVGVLTSISDTKAGIKHALIAGMIAAIVFNILYIPFQFVLGGVQGAAMGTDSAAGAAAITSFVSGFGALLNLVGVAIFSPIGYVIGGAIGSFFNG